MTRTDRDHLKILAICHYVMGGLCFVFGSFPGIYLVMGLAIINGDLGPPQQPANGPNGVLYAPQGGGGGLLQLTATGP